MYNQASQSNGLGWKQCMNEAITNWSKYQKRIRSVIEYIHNHPGESLSSDRLADIAHLSPYHWHRIYKSITGESAAATVKRCRMHNAAAALLRTDTPIVEIGASVGYPEIHSFTRTFKQFYSISPGKFREAQTEANTLEQESDVEVVQRYDVEIKNKPAAYLIGSWHRGDYMTIGLTFESVMAQCAMSGIMPENPQTMGLYLSDPECTDEPALRSFAGIVMSAEVAVPAGLEVYDYPGGNFAAVTHHGPYALLSQGYEWLYYKWLPSSEASVRDQPCSEVYLNSPLETPQTELLTEICLPIE